MIYFLVRADVCHTPYMGREKVIKDVRLVLAHDLADAERKYNSYWDHKSQSYSDSYYVSSMDIMETII